MYLRYRLLLIGVMCLLPVLVHAASAKNLRPLEAYEMVQQRENLFLLDVRTPQEYFQARLQGAHLIPIDQLVSRLDEIPRNRPVMVYCELPGSQWLSRGLQHVWWDLYVGKQRLPLSPGPSLNNHVSNAERPGAIAVAAAPCLSIKKG